MRRKAIIIILGLLVLPLSTFAQPEADTLMWRQDPLYLQLFGGTNKSANENLPWTEFTRYPWAWGVFMALGKEFTPLWGWRAAVRFNQNKSRNVPVCESYDTWGWKNVGVFADGTFDISDVFRLNRALEKPPVFNLKAFAGFGLAYTFGFDQVPLSYTHPYLRSSRVVPAGRFGLTANFRVSNRLRIGTELSHTFFEDHFNGVAYGEPLDSRTNLKVGITLMLYKEEKPASTVVRLNRLTACPPLPFIIPEPEPIKARELEGHAFLDFPVNETIIYPEYRKNPEELARIQATVDSVMFDKSVTVTRITLHGYASPESPYSNNVRLASGRVEALKRHLMDKHSFPEDVFSISYTPEDWGNLRSFIDIMDGRRVKGDFWYDNKDYVETPPAPAVLRNYRDELLEIIDREMDQDQKEEVLKRVGGGEPYRWLLKYVYPGLRHTDYIIQYEVMAYQVKDGRRLIYTHPEALSLNEMFEVANSYPEGSEEWFDAFIIAARQYPRDETANLNAACACTRTRRLSDAKRYLQLSGSSERALYVADVIQAMEGRVQWHMEGSKVVLD